MAMSLKHLAHGSAWPTLARDTLRLYSMHFCPYAQRTRLVLAAKHIPHELINVNLKYKPDWFLARNPYGLVPVVEMNGSAVSESVVCDDFLEELYPEYPLYPKDPWEKARHKTLIAQFEKVADGLNGAKSKNVERKEKALKGMSKGLALFEEALKDKFFGGSSPGMLDYHMWPWYERIPALEILTGITLLPREQYPKLSQWMEDMLQVPAVKAIWINDELHMKFFRSFATGTPHYDAAFEAVL